MKKKLINYLKIIIKAYFIIFYIIIVLSLVITGITFGIITIIPDEASKPCYLGYYAHCSFTPYSIILFAMALKCIFLLIKLVKYFNFKLKYKKTSEKNSSNVVIFLN